jgi:hypothetical protein
MYVLPPDLVVLADRDPLLASRRSHCDCKTPKTRRDFSELRLNFNGASTPASVFPVPTVSAVLFWRSLAPEFQFDLVVRLGSRLDEGFVRGACYAGISSTYTRYTLRVQSVLRQKASGTPSTLLIEEVGGVPVPILQPGAYVVFLVKTARTDTLTTYFVADGLNGAFSLRSAAVYRECANYQSPANLIEASGRGQGMSQADFSNQVRALPAMAGPPHK